MDGCYCVNSLIICKLAHNSSYMFSACPNQAFNSLQNLGKENDHVTSQISFQWVFVFYLELREIDLFLLHLTCSRGHPVSVQFRVSYQNITPFIQNLTNALSLSG